MLKSIDQYPPFWRRSGNLLLRSLIVLLLLSLVSCTLFGEEDKDDDTLKETQIALAIQQTRLAEQQLQATQAAGQPPAPPQGGEPQQPTPDMAATQVELSVQQTLAASGGATQPPAQAPTEPPPPPPDTPAAPPPTSPPAADFQTMMKSASILVYEDIANDVTETPYVQRTLKAMGLNHKWDGSAKGRFKSDLLGGAPTGGPWDLVIMAAETRTGIQGEFFEYLNDVLNLGSSVIIEAWHLDEISAGTVSTILTRCGVQVYEYFPKTGQSMDAVVYPLSGVMHPILSDPNSGLSFTRARTKWIPTGDLGDKMALTGRGDAMLLLGTEATDNTKDGVLAVCLGGQLTMQTFSSHSFEYNTMYPLWENMITQALKVRLLGAQQ